MPWGAGGALGGGLGGDRALWVPSWLLSTPGSCFSHPKPGGQGRHWWAAEGFWDASCLWTPMDTSGPSGGGSLVPRVPALAVSGQAGWGHRQGSGDGEIAAAPPGPPVNYLASMFINQQFLCKQTHPKPLLPVTLATAQSRPWLGMCSGLPPGPQPRLKLFARSLFLPQGGFRPLDLPITESWTFGLLGPGSVHH